MMGGFVPFGNGVRISLDSRFIEFLHDSKIFSHQNYDIQRWKEGDPMCFLRSAEMEPYSAVYRGEFMNSLGAFSFITNPIIGTYQMEFSTGRYCSIGGGLRIVGNAHPIASLSSSPIFYDKKESWVRSYNEDHGITGAPLVTRNPAKGAPKIGHDVWFGSDVYLNQAVRIGNGAVIAANSHVTKDVPDYAIVGGNPARVIRYRFPTPIIRELMDIQFWRFSMRDLQQLNVQDIEQFIRDFREAEGQLKPWNPTRINIWESWCKINQT